MGVLASGQETVSSQKGHIPLRTGSDAILIWELWKDWPSVSDESMDVAPPKSSEFHPPESHPTRSSRVSHWGRRRLSFPFGNWSTILRALSSRLGWYHKLRPHHGSCLRLLLLFLNRILSHLIGNFIHRMQTHRIFHSGNRLRLGSFGLTLRSAKSC